MFLVHPDELDQVFDSEVGERLDAVFADAIGWLYLRLRAGAEPDFDPETTR